MSGAREQDIVRVEASVGARLPEWLRERLLSENGFILDDSAGTTGRRWRMLPVRDDGDRKRMMRTAEDIARATAIARAVDRVSAPGFGEPQPGRPFPSDAVVIGVGWSEAERLALLPDPDNRGRLGMTVYRQMQFAPIESLGLGVDELAPDPTTFDTGEELPAFRYHPDPVATGSVRRSPNACSCCERRRGWEYVPRPYGRAEFAHICPWCIADGSAARAGARFVDTWALDEAGIAPDIQHDVATRTPGFATYQPEEWQSHCGDAAAFIGELDAGGLRLLAPERRDALGVTAEAIELVAQQQAGFAVFGFRCLHCGATLGFLDVD